MLRPNIWIYCSQQHFVDLKPNPHTDWISNEHCPDGPFLVGLRVGNRETGDHAFQWFKVILTDYGLMELVDGEESELGWEPEDIEVWQIIESPIFDNPFRA